MERIFAFFAATVLYSASLYGAEFIKCDTLTVSTVADSTSASVARPASPVDSSLAGLSVYDYISSIDGGKIVIRKNAAIDTAFEKYILANPDRRVSGYRIRLYFDNKQDARTVSSDIEEKFREAFPKIPVYRSYNSPFFKVVVGDFRTKSDAVTVLDTVKRSFPDAFIIRERIIYPSFSTTLL